ncbi:MAG: D-alanyl-D-alanine carboxypeptidase/D-alanyl-D-alanine-endopeptidase [Bacteroidota bacterium]
MRQLLIILSFVSTLSCATEPPLVAQSLDEVVNALIDDRVLRYAQVGLSIIDVENGRTLADHQADRALIPASTQKLVTTAAALDILGTEAKFRTRVFLDGSLKEGVLSGDIYIVGGGDPTLGSPNMTDARDMDEVLNAWVAAIRKAGVRQVDGRVIGDGSYYGTAGLDMNWPWSDLGNYYGAGAYGLNLHENFYYLDFSRTKRLGTIPAISRIRPEIPELEFKNEVRIAEAGTGDNAYIYGAPFNYNHFIRGTIPAGNGRFTIKGSIPNPPLFAAQRLQSKLEASGISLSQVAASALSLGRLYLAGGREIHRTESPSMLEICQRTNLRSVNLYAEALLREINKSRALESFELGSPQTILDWLAESGISTEGVRLDDGSGLSPRNYFPPRLLTSLLFYKRDDADYLSTIPLAGRTGSLRNRLKGTAAEGRVYAKSGSLAGVRAYAGYVNRADGRRLAFSIMVNNYTTPAKDVGRLLLDFMVNLCTADIFEG